jgi:hypothetical protein
MFALATNRVRQIGPRLAWVMLAVVFAAAIGDVAAAQDKEKSTFEVSVWGIRATKANDKISPELKQIAKELKKYSKYTGFKLEKKKSAKVSKGKVLTVDLVGGYKVKVTPVEQQGNRVKLKVEVPQRETKKDTKEDKDKKKKKPLVSTTFTITQAKFQLLGGWKIDSTGEDVLIIAVSAR